MITITLRVVVGFFPLAKMEIDKSSSNSGRGCLRLTSSKYTWEMHESISSFQLWVNKKERLGSLILAKEPI